MPLEFFKFSVDAIRDLATTHALESGEEQRFGWVNVVVAFGNVKTTPQSGVRITVPVSYERDWSLEQVREAALEQAKEVIAATAQLFDAHDLQQLQQLSDEIQDHENTSLADFQLSLQDAADALGEDD